MKRLFYIGAIALLLNGIWGTVLAAASCPRAKGHACCRAKSSGHEKMAMPAHERVEMHVSMTMDGMHEVAAIPQCDEAEVALVQTPESCAHCTSRSGDSSRAAVVPYAPAQTARDLSAATPATLKRLVSPVSSIPLPVASRQHSPPRSSTSRHILISVFLI